MNITSRDRLLLELRLDGHATDSSGRGHPVVVHGGRPTTDRFGRPAGALLFGGIDDHLVMPALPLTTTRLSVSLWARVDTLDLHGWSNCLICQDNGDDRDQSRRIFQLSLFRGRVVWHRMMRAHDPSSRQVVRPGQWFHVAAVVEQDLHRLYVDGQLQDTVTDPLGSHAEEAVYLGRKGTSERYFFLHGALDDVRIFDRALDAIEVRSLYLEAGYVPPRAASRDDPISGIWETDDGDRIELTLADERVLTGVVSAGHPGNLAAIKRGTFDRQTGAFTLVGEARRPDNGTVTDYEIDGSLDRAGLTVNYRFGSDRGSATLARLTPGRLLRRRVARVARRALERLEPVLVPLVRWRRSRLRPTRAANARLFRERGETIDSLIFRAAVVSDIPLLAALHVTTWAATYPDVRRPPTFAIRERQWREAFAHRDGTWFCLVIENAKRELVGFAKGVKQSSGAGDLSKIYLLEEYQRMGIGRRLMGHVARRFLSEGVSSMTLSADPANPSCAFYRALGGEERRDARGRLERGSFVWRDLERLASICPLDLAGDGPGAATAAHQSHQSNQ